jgi:ribosomal protein S17
MTEQAVVETGTEGAMRTLTGRVVSSKMQKTITVAVERLVKHWRTTRTARAARVTSSTSPSAAASPAARHGDWCASSSAQPRSEPGDVKESRP